MTDLLDPLGMDESPEESSEASGASGSKKQKKERNAKELRPRHRDKSKDGGLGAYLQKRRIEQNTKKSSVNRVGTFDADEEIDEDEIISVYMPHRRARRLAAFLLRMDKLRLFLLCALLIIGGLFILSFMQEKMGNFTINLDRLELYRKGISISEDGNFTYPTSRLSAAPVIDATNISIHDLPAGLESVDGDHNGINYVAYTYYVRNAGKEDVGYRATLRLESAAKGAEEAVRVAVWHNNEPKVVYAEPAKRGGDEDGCVSFENHDTVVSFEEQDFLVGNVDKFTVVIWMEGDDPECIDDIVGGSIEFSMKIDAFNEDDTTLFWKFIKDIKDTLKGDRPINAAGTESPDIIYDNVTWETRRNQF